jgi:hypothetical protein
MENNQLDELFRKGLSDHAAIPSPDAWARLEAARGKRQKPFFWWMLAASMALVLGIAAIYMAGERVDASQSDAHMLAEVSASSADIANEDIPQPQVEVALIEQAKSEPKKVEVARAMKPSKPDSKSAEVLKVEMEVAELQRIIRMPEPEGFDPIRVVPPVEIQMPKTVIESAGFEVQIFRGLTAPDSVKRAQAARKNILKQVIHFAQEVHAGEVELPDLQNIKNSALEKLSKERNNLN